MKKVLVAMVTALVLLCGMVVAEASNAPCGFEKVRTLIEQNGTLAPSGSKYLTVMMPDPDQAANPGGMLEVFAASGSKGIGVGVASFTKEETILFAVAIYYFYEAGEEAGFVKQNLESGQEIQIYKDEACYLVDAWLALYTLAKE